MGDLKSPKIIYLYELTSIIGGLEIIFSKIYPNM